jgi:hypothetical protein
MNPDDIDAVAYGITHVVGSKAGTWANQALDYALNTDAAFVAVAYLKPPEVFRYERSRWFIQPMPSRAALDAWYQGLAADPSSYHYAAEFDKTVPEWGTGRAVAAIAEPIAYASGVVGAAPEPIAYVPVGAAPSVHDQLAHLDHLVALHETFWARVAQEHPTSEMRVFLRDHWDPWFARWWETRPLLVAADSVHEAAQGLSGLRELAAYNGIPTPDLGTSQHGFVRPGELPMVSGDHDYVGADAIESYRAVASQAVRNAHHQRPAPVFGYLRAGTHQKVYLFNTLDEAHAWYVQLEPGYDYAAMFGADLHVPITEDLGGAIVSGDSSTEVGHWLLPLALGVPAGAYGGYRYREWQEAHPGKIIPWIGAQADSDVARRHAWPRTQLLIQSAIHNVLEWDQKKPDEWDEYGLYDARTSGAPVGAYVWHLGPLGAAGALFSTYDEALAHMRDAIHTDHAALALFDKMSPHWPNPVNWTKNDDPTHESAIAAQIAHSAPLTSANKAAFAAQVAQARQRAQAMRTAGWVDMIGGAPWYEIVGAAIDVLRKQAQAAAEEMPGRVVGILRDAQNQWKLKSFHDADDADDWFAHSTRNAASYTYAAYFDKDDPLFPHPLNEKIGGARASSVPGSPIPRVVAEV